MRAALRPVNQTEHTDGGTDGRYGDAMLLGENQDEEEDEDGVEVESRKHTEDKCLWTTDGWLRPCFYPHFLVEKS